MLNVRPVKLLPVREQAAASLREAIITQIVCENKADLTEIENLMAHSLNSNSENYSDFNQSFHYHIWNDILTRYE